MSPPNKYITHKDTSLLKTLKSIFRLAPCFLIMLFRICPISNAQIIHVPNDQATIQSGINNAQDGDTVLIAEGTYFEGINFLGKAITVASYYYIDGDTSHISRTIINGSRLAHPETASVVTFRNGEDTTSILAGLKITGGRGTFIRNIHTIKGFEQVAYCCGGGILIYNSGAKIIHNIIIANNITATDSARGPLGCGIMAAVNHNHSCIIRNNIVQYNTGRGNQGWGAGMSLHGGRFLVEYNTIHHNQLTVNGLSVGGGVLYEYENQPGTIDEVIIRNNIIKENTGNSTYSMGFGGGIGFCLRLEKGRIQVHNNIIAENHVDGSGGGIYCYETNALVYNNFIFDNSATLSGEGIFMDDNSEIKVETNTIWAGNMWILSEKGLKKLFPGDVGINDYTGDGVIRTEPSTNYFSIDPGSGGIHVGEGEGFILVNPKITSFSKFVPPAVLVDFNSGNENEMGPYPVKNNPETPAHGSLILSQNENFISFKFQVLDNYGTSEHQFKYFMKGVENDTVLSDPGRHTQYSNLKPGRYTFWVSRSKDAEVWEPGISINIRVKPLWYRSYIAYGAYIITLCILVFLIIRSRLKKFRIEKIILENEVAKRTIEINEKNQQIIEVEQLKTRFFTDISHEIRTPLSLIVGPLENILENGAVGQKEKEWFNIIKRNSERITHLVNQLLDISRLDAGYMKLILEKYDVISHLRVLTSEYESQAERKNIKFITDLPDMELVSFYDKEKTERITTNLLSNAFKFTPDHGTITCRIKVYKSKTKGSDHILRIIVSDTGPGIPIKDRERIFDRFFKSAGESYNNRGGTGIGLSLTRDLIKLMHGEISVRSLEGKGSIFLATFPLGIAHLNETEYIIKEKIEHTPADESLTNEKDKGIDFNNTENLNPEVLLVEDNDELRSFISDNLKGSFSLYEAEDGIKAWEQAINNIPDLIISDVMMPGMDGMELCQRLKEDERTSHIPVILLTARSTSKDVIEGLEQGADAYIFKPFSVGELTTRINNLLEQRERLRKKYSNMIGLDWGEMTVTTLDEKFLKNVTGIITENLEKFDFDVNTLQKQMLMSRGHLFRKLKALTGESPSSLIRLIRLKTAASFIENGEENITEISLNVGFSNPSYFAQCFKEYFGKTPSEYKKTK